MNMEDNMNNLYFTPLSLSQLLKEKGVKQDISLFAWFYDYVLHEWELLSKGDVEYLKQTQGFYNRYNKGEYYTAFTLSELPDVLRQMYFGKKMSDEIQDEFSLFCWFYYIEPQKAWETLENTIRSL